MDLLFPHHMSAADIAVLSLLLEQTSLYENETSEGTESSDVAAVKF
jgi:hypothetical protein